MGYTGVSAFRVVRLALAFLGRAGACRGRFRGIFGNLDAWDGARDYDISVVVDRFGFSFGL